MPAKISYLMIAIIPGILVCLLILKNAYLGVLAFYFYSFLRPYDFIPALRPLRFTMIIEIVTLLAWIIHVFITKQKLKWCNFNWFFLGFVAVIGLTVITARNNFYAYENFLAMFTYFVIFFVASNIIDSEKRVYRIIWLLMLIHAYFALKGTYTFVTGQHIDALGKTTSGIVGSGFIGDENDFALAINVFVPFAYFGVIYFKGKLKLVSLGLLTIFIMGVVSSFSRGGLVGLVCLTIYCILSSKRKLAGLGVALVAAVLMVIFAPASYWQEAESIQDVNEGTAMSRIRYWEAAFKMYADHPLIGVGAGNGGIHMPEYVYVGEDRDPNTQYGRAFHGTMPQIFAELGTLGAVCYIIMLVMAVLLMRKVIKAHAGKEDSDLPVYLARSLIGSVIAYITTATFISTAYYPYLWTIYTLIVALALAWKSADRQNAATAPVMAVNDRPGALSTITNGS